MAENTKVIAEYNDIKAVADAIRTKKNIAGDMLLKDMPSNVLSIEGGLDTSDATITPETVFLNETGYANGQKVTGTFTIEDEVTAQENLISQISAALEGKAAGGGVNVETCAVSFDNSQGAIYKVNMTIVEDSNVIGCDLFANEIEGKTFNIVKDSVFELVLHGNDYDILNIDYDLNYRVYVSSMGGTTYTNFIINKPIDGTIISYDRDGL